MHGGCGRHERGCVQHCSTHGLATVVACGGDNAVVVFETMRGGMCASVVMVMGMSSTHCIANQVLMETQDVEAMMSERLELWLQWRCHV